MLEVSASLIRACLLAEQLCLGTWLQDSVAGKLHFVDDRAKVNADTI